MLSAEIQQRAFSQIMSIYVLPEIRSRQEKKKIPKPFNLFAAQIIFRKRQGNIIRLNEECKLMFVGKTKEGVKVKKGEKFGLDKIKAVENIKIIEEDGNEAHISIVRLGKTYYYNFDFRYDKRCAKNILNAAAEFLQAAKDDCQAKRWRPFTENMFLVGELLIRAELTLLPYIKTESKKHEYWRVEYNKWFKLRNTTPERKNFLNEVYGLRDKARYSESNFKIHHNKAKNFLRITTSMLNDLVKQVS